MTQIQAQSIPVLLTQRDLIGQAKTGSGKTAAYALPILQKIKLGTRNIQAVVLCPTRELCTQVAKDIRKFGRRHPRLQVLILCGGVPVPPQSQALRTGVHIIVGTPGRVLDHLQRGRLDLSRVSTLVLDEADRMLDMGFEEDMAEILNEMPGTRQTVFFSATFNPTMKAMSLRYQIDPVSVKVEETPETETSIRQILHETQDDKFYELLRALKQYRPPSVIVFCNLKTTVKEVTDQLRLKGIPAAGLSGDLEQQDRDAVMAMFRGGSVRVLVATDVAARGLDITDLAMVINYDFPNEPDTYVHRIGRTGRAGKEGLALTLVTAYEAMKVHELEGRAGVKFEPAGSSGGASPLSEIASFEPAMDTLYISGGRKDKVRPGDILGALTGESGGFEGSDIGKIEIHDHFSFVAVSRRIATAALVKMANGRIKGKKFVTRQLKSENF